jgi:hypothetical protein
MAMKQSLDGLIANVNRVLRSGSHASGWAFALDELLGNLRELKSRWRSGDKEVVEEFFDVYTLEGADERKVNHAGNGQ